jgi:hypothetical protein
MNQAHSSKAKGKTREPIAVDHGKRTENTKKKKKKKQKKNKKTKKKNKKKQKKKKKKHFTLRTI